MRKFHHIGIPTKKKRPNETYLKDAKVYVTDAGADAYGIEWLRFEPGSPMPDQLKKTAHVAYMVDDLVAEMKDQEALIPPFSPMPGLMVAFILHDGAPVEFMHQA